MYSSFQGGRRSRRGGGRGPRGRAGGAGEAALIDNDSCKEYGLRGMSHATAFMTKAAATVDGARLRNPDTGDKESIPWYAKAAKEAVNRRPSCCRVSRGATIPGSER
jgi:hypothetical protein